MIFGLKWEIAVSASHNIFSNYYKIERKKRIPIMDHWVLTGKWLQGYPMSSRNFYDKEKIERQ